jgi:hypothetical protein
MASENFYNTGDEFMQNYEKNPYRFMKKRATVRNVAPKLYSGAEKAYNRMNPEEQKMMKRKLQNLQKKSPNLAKALAAKKPSAIVGLAKNLRRNIHFSTDWLFILLFSFGLLKDIFDIVFAAAGTAAGTLINLIPIIGQIGSVTMMAIGMTVTFVGELMFLILTVTVLVLVGSSIKNRGPAKYFVSTAMEFIAEALPGISWLPWTPVYVLILYLFVLYDRSYQESKEQTAKINIPASGAADNYYQDERLAA